MIWVILMKQLKSYTLIGILVVSILGTALHFAFAWANYNPIIGLFTPVNESTWEHMKLLFFPMLIYALYMNKKLRSQYPCAASSLAFGTLLGTFLIPVIFYIYSGILGFHCLVMDIATFYICVISAFYVAYKLTLSYKAEPYKTLLLCLLCIIAIAFLVFTVYPPKIGLFADPMAY